MSVWRIPVTLTGANPDNPFINVFHLQSDDVNDPLTDCAAALASLRTFYVALTTSVAEVGQPLADGLTITSGTVTNVATQEQSTLPFAPIAPISGGGRAPERLALVIGWKSTIAARRARGRTFIGPLSNFVAGTDGLPKQPMIDLVTNAAVGLRDRAIGGGHAHWVTYGLVQPGGGPKDPHTGYIRLGVSVKRKFATLRTRG